MDIIGVGRSELPGRTMGVQQTMERGAGLQVIGFMNEIERLTGYRLTVNEGRRSRPDQRLVWNAYALYLAGRGPWAPKAALCYTSIHDEILHGNAVDFGGPGGEVIPADVHAVMVQLAEKYGVYWTGQSFGEWWHFEVNRSRARVQVREGTTRIGAGAAPADPSTDTAPAEQENDDMSVAVIETKGGSTPGIYMVDHGKHEKWNIIRGCSSVDQAMGRLNTWQNMGIRFYAAQTPSLLAGYTDTTSTTDTKTKD